MNLRNTSLPSLNPGFQHLPENLNQCPLANAALHYATLGLRIFPLQPNSKLPMPGWSWKRIATSDAAVIADWWRQWPTANIAISTGAASGIDALDIDQKNGADGLRSYQAIVQEPYPGPVQSTPSGGQHLLFQHTPQLRNFTHRGAHGGVDMRTEGGYIVAAPSVIDGKRYQWSRGGTIPTLPLALAVACRQWSSQPNTAYVDAPEVPDDLPDARQLRLPAQYLRYLEHGDTSPWRHDESRSMFAVAGALMRALQDPGQVYGIMCANPHAWTCAERHRSFGDPATWLWKYGIGKIVSAAEVKSALDVFSPVPQASTQATTDAPAESFFVRASTGRERAQLAPQWIVRGLMERAQVGIVYGASQSYKSYLMLDLSAAVTLGHHWHDHPVIAPGPVWFLAGEGNAILWRRLEVLRQVRRIHSDHLAELWLSTGGLNLMDPKHLQTLQAQANAHGAPRLLIVDTLSTNAILDENNARDCSELIAICYRLASQWGTTVVLVHHIGKSDKLNPRGSSALQTNPDFKMRLERMAGQRLVTQFHIEKLKGAPEPMEPLLFEGNSHAIVGVLNDDMSPVTDLVFSRLSADLLPHADVSRERRLSVSEFEFAGRIKEIILARSPFGDPDRGMMRHELHGEYRRLDSGMGEDKFNRYLDAAINSHSVGILTEGESQIIKINPTV